MSTALRKLCVFSVATVVLFIELCLLLTCCVHPKPLAPMPYSYVADLSSLNIAVADYGAIVGGNCIHGCTSMLSPVRGYQSVMEHCWSLQEHTHSHTLAVVLGNRFKLTHLQSPTSLSCLVSYLLLCTNTDSTLLCIICSSSQGLSGGGAPCPGTLAKRQCHKRSQRVHTRWQVVWCWMLAGH